MGRTTQQLSERALRCRGSSLEASGACGGTPPPLLEFHSSTRHLAGRHGRHSGQRTTGGVGTVWGWCGISGVWVLHHGQRQAPGGGPRRCSGVGGTGGPCGPAGGNLTQKVRLSWVTGLSQAARGRSLASLLVVCLRENRFFGKVAMIICASQTRQGGYSDPRSFHGGADCRRLEPEKAQLLVGTLARPGSPSSGKLSVEGLSWATETYAASHQVSRDRLAQRLTALRRRPASGGHQVASQAKITAVLMVG